MKILFNEWERGVKEAVGISIVIDGFSKDAKLLDNEKKIEKILVEAAKKAGATVLDTKMRKFAPQGVTGYVLLAESHIAIHTWPEYGFVTIDVYTCGNHTMPEKAAEYIIGKLKIEKARIAKMRRGKFE